MYLYIRIHNTQKARSYTNQLSSVQIGKRANVLHRSCPSRLLYGAKASWVTGRIQQVQRTGTTNAQQKQKQK